MGDSFPVAPTIAPAMPLVNSGSCIGRAPPQSCAVQEAGLGSGHCPAENEIPMSNFLVPVIEVAIVLINLYWWVVILAAVASWLMAFGVINTHNRGVARVVDILYRLTEPALAPIQRILPNFGGVDISPVILLVILWFITMELRQLEFYLLTMS